MARDLFCAQGLPSYGDLKGTRLKALMKKIVPSLRLVYGKWDFQMWQRLVPFSAETMVNKMVV